jgi:hypothetical protein
MEVHGIRREANRAIKNQNRTANMPTIAVRDANIGWIEAPGSPFSQVEKMWIRRMPVTNIGITVNIIPVTDGRRKTGWLRRDARALEPSRLDSAPPQPGLPPGASSGSAHPFRFQHAID